MEMALKRTNSTLMIITDNLKSMSELSKKLQNSSQLKAQTSSSKNSSDSSKRKVTKLLHQRINIRLRLLFLTTRCKQYLRLMLISLRLIKRNTALNSKELVETALNLSSNMNKLRKSSTLKIPSIENIQNNLLLKYN